MIRPSQVRIDFLAYKPMRRVLRSPAFPLAHLAKTMAKSASWGGFLPLALRNPPGVETFRQIAAHTLTAPAGMLGLSVVGWMMLGLTLLMAWRAWIWARQVPTEFMTAARAGLAGAALLFGAVLTVWAWPVA